VCWEILEVDCAALGAPVELSMQRSVRTQLSHEIGVLRAPADRIVGPLRGDAMSLMLSALRLLIHGYGTPVPRQVFRAQRSGFTAVVVPVGSGTSRNRESDRNPSEPSLDLSSELGVRGRRARVRCDEGGMDARWSILRVLHAELGRPSALALAAVRL
jgi:hypothetical protein